MSIATGVMTRERVVSAAEERRVIVASSVGTVFEWYDFYLYAILAPFFAGLFFPPGNQTAALLGAFGAYAAGFLIRPFGALIFGRIGDIVGRKYTFLVTIVVMGVSTVLVGFMPTYASLGFAAPLVLDRKSTRLNSSHTVISYAVFCLKKKTQTERTPPEQA